MKKVEKNVELKAARVRAGKTQQECADALGITRIMYAQKERGLNGFSLDQAGVLSAFLQIPKQDFFLVGRMCDMSYLVTLTTLNILGIT